MVCVLGVGHGSPPDDDSFCGYFGKENEEYGGCVRNVYTPFCYHSLCRILLPTISRQDRIEVSLSLESFRPVPNHELKPLSVPSTERSTMTQSKVSGRFKHPPPTQVSTPKHSADYRYKVKHRPPWPPPLPVPPSPFLASEIEKIHQCGGFRTL